MTRAHKSSFCLAAVLSLSCSSALAADPAWTAKSKHGMVASDSPEASQIGADILAAGGNAFDAAVATSFALTVARPHSTGIGGGGFMVAYVAKERRFVALDFREIAPAGATAARYADLHERQGDGPSASIYGGNAIGIPGVPAGLAAIRERYGTRPLADLVAPAIDLAEGGFTLDKSFLSARDEVVADLDKWPDLTRTCSAMHAWLTDGGQSFAVGSKLRRPVIAGALRRIADEGVDAFYHGAIAEAIVQAVQAADGTMTAADLAGYRVKWREPVRANWRDFEIVSMPPPSSGGVCIVETLNVFDALRAKHEDAATTFSDAQAPLLVRSFKHAFADRARWLGDPDFTEIPIQRLTSREYAAELAAKAATALDDYGSQQIPDDGGTSHFCVADEQGNIVAITETVNGAFGSLVMTEPFGIILNNQMDDFLTVPGEANLFGLQQGDAALVGPGKRPLSSMSPTIVFRGGKPFLTLGASGGPRIITSVTQVALRVMCGESLSDAMSAVRLHHQWRPDRVYFDREPPDSLAKSLTDAGEELSDTRKTGVVQAIRFLDDGTMIGASDPRKGGRPAGLAD